MSLIRDEPAYLFLGLALLAATAACGDLAGVPYNAMLRQLSTPETSGRISGFGSAAGYLGSVVLLLIVYFGFIMGDGPTRGCSACPSTTGTTCASAMLVTAVWFAVFALPLLFTAHHLLPAGRDGARSRSACSVPTARCGRDISAEWHRDRNLVYYLMASAIFRDGLVGVFTFGAVLGRQRLRHLAGRRADVRRGRQRGGRGRRRARRATSTTGSGPSRSSSGR